MPDHLKNSLKEVYLKVRKTLLLPFLLLRRTKIPEEGEIKRILFLRHDRIGDMVISTALLKAVKRTFPSAMITVLASKRNYEILKDNPNVDEVLIYRGFIRFIKEILARGYDLAIDPFVTYELRQAFMVYISRARYRIGFEKAGREVFFNLKGPSASKEKRMVELLLGLSEALGGEREGCDPEVFLTNDEIRWASESLVSRGIGIDELKIAVHPGGHYPSQRWKAERFGEIGRRIIEEYGAKVLIFGSQEEKNLLTRVKEVAGVRVHLFSGLRLREFIALLSMCNLMVCNNSGPLHIASALKIPTVSIMGPTDSPLWLPWGDNHIVIRKDIECSPCNKAICKDHKCMESITVEEVMEAVRSQIDRHKNLLQLNPQLSYN